MYCHSLTFKLVLSFLFGCGLGWIAVSVAVIVVRAVGAV